ncbi:hypothetical protein ACO0K7_18680 [Undibacterium sp. Ji67W]|uniref:hypothetical protein n=1 Tax=Undibacterium sp. Ji67W TaxID=3413042 RepID=UPI003BF33ECD
MQPIDTKPQSGNLTQTHIEMRQVYTAPILISLGDSETEHNTGLGPDGGGSLFTSHS